MNSPMIRRSSSRICVPELSLENLATRRVETAGVQDGSSIMAAQLRIGARRSPRRRVVCKEQSYIQGRRDGGTN